MDNQQEQVLDSSREQKHESGANLCMHEFKEIGANSKAPVVSNIFRKFIFVRQLNAPYPADSFSVSSLVETR